MASFPFLPVRLFVPAVRARFDTLRCQTCVAAVLGLWLALLVAVPASADFAIDLLWTSSTGSGVPGSNVISASPGDELELDIIATVDAASYERDLDGNITAVLAPGGVDAYSLSLEFDLAGLDELDLLETTELDHMARFPCDPLIEAQLGPLACFDDFGNELVNMDLGIEEEIESEPGFTGLAAGFEAGAALPGPGMGVENLSFRVGRIRFLVTENVASGGFDLEASLLVDLLDGYSDDSLTLFMVPGDLPDPRIVPGFARVDRVPEPGAGLLAAAAVGVLAGLRSARRRVARARS